MMEDENDNDDIMVDGDYISPPYPNFMKTILTKRPINLKSCHSTHASYKINTFAANLWTYTATLIVS